MSAVERHEELVSAAAVAKARLQDLQDEAKRRARELTEALHARDGLDRAVGRGEEINADEEERLAALLAEPGVELRPNDHGRAMVDQRAEARVEGAAAALADAKVELLGHARQHLPELLADAAEGGEEARDELAAAVEQMEAAEANWTTIARRATNLLVLASDGPPEAALLRRELEAQGWRLLGVPVSVDGQGSADFAAAMRRDPDSVLPIVVPPPAGKAEAA